MLLFPNLLQVSCISLYFFKNQDILLYNDNTTIKIRKLALTQYCFPSSNFSDVWIMCLLCSGSNPGTCSCSPGSHDFYFPSIWNNSSVFIFHIFEPARPVTLQNILQFEFVRCFLMIYELLAVISAKYSHGIISLGTDCWFVHLLMITSITWLNVSIKFLYCEVNHCLHSPINDYKQVFWELLLHIFYYKLELFLLPHFLIWV